MTCSSSCPLLGGVANLLIVLLHLALALRPQCYRHFGADALAQMHEQGSRFAVLATLRSAFSSTTTKVVACGSGIPGPGMFLLGLAML
jgi:hypothetical protein